MTSIITSHHCKWSPGMQWNLSNGRFKKVSFSGYSTSYFPPGGLSYFHGEHHAPYNHRSTWKYRPIFSSTLDDPMDSDDSEDEADSKESPKGETEEVCFLALLF